MRRGMLSLGIALLGSALWVGAAQPEPPKDRQMANGPPPTATFIEGVSSHALWAGLQGKLLPAERDKWFGVDLHGSSWRGMMPKRAEATSPVTTGSITKSEPKP